MVTGSAPISVDVINFLKIYNVEKYDADEELKELIDCCEGEGCFYE